MWLIIDPSTLVDNSDIVFSSPGYDNLELFRIHYQTGSLTTTIENRTFTITS